MNLRPVLLMLERLKEWVMLDIYLVGIAVASIKVKDYADIAVGYGLVAFVALMVLSLLTMIHLNMEQLWHRFYPQPEPDVAPEKLQICLNCHHTGLPDDRGRCPRCHTGWRIVVLIACKITGGAYLRDRATDSGQSAADLNYLPERRTPGGHHFLRYSFARLRQYSGGGDCVYRQHSGAVHQSVGPAGIVDQHSFSLPAGTKTRIRLLRLVTGSGVGLCWTCLLFR